MTFLTALFFGVIPLILSVESKGQPLSLQKPDLRELMLQSYNRNVTYVPPPLSSIDRAEFLFLSLLRTRAISPGDEGEWASLGLKLEEALHNSERYAVISEVDPLTQKGHGFYAIRIGDVTVPQRDKVLQGPHRPSDLYTHEIVFDLLTLSETFGGAAWSTTHRDNVDLCKEPLSYFNAFTKAFANSVEIPRQPLILQVHGFSKASYDPPTDAVFSSTKEEGTPADLLPVASCLKGALDPFILRSFPEEVDFLGGTLNVNADLFYETNQQGRFIHFESSYELREELRANTELKQLMDGTDPDFLLWAIPQNHSHWPKWGRGHQNHTRGTNHITTSRDFRGLRDFFMYCDL